MLWDAFSGDFLDPSVLDVVLEPNFIGEFYDTFSMLQNIFSAFPNILPNVLGFYTDQVTSSKAIPV